MAIVHFVNYKRGTQSRAAMRGVMLYVMQDKKTTWEGAPLVSGINCQPQSVYDDFLNTKLLYHKDGGVMFYHMVQSFPKGAAVDPRQAHEAARRLAEYFDGGGAAAGYEGLRRESGGAGAVAGGNRGTGIGCAGEPVSGAAEPAAFAGGGQHCPGLGQL